MLSLKQALHRIGALDPLSCVPGLNLAQEKKTLCRPYKRPCFDPSPVVPSPVVPNPAKPDDVAFGLGIVVSDSVPMDMSQDAENAEVRGVEPPDSEDEEYADDEDSEESQPPDAEPAEPPRKRFCPGLYVEVPADRLPDPASPIGRCLGRDSECSGEDTKVASSEDAPSSPGFCPRDCMLLCCIDKHAAEVRQAHCARIRQQKEEREKYLDSLPPQEREDTPDGDFKW